MRGDDKVRAGEGLGVREGRGGEEGSVSAEPAPAQVERGGGASTLPEGLAEEEELRRGQRLREGGCIARSRVPFASEAGGEEVVGEFGDVLKGGGEEDGDCFLGVVDGVEDVQNAPEVGGRDGGAGSIVDLRGRQDLDEGELGDVCGRVLVGGVDGGNHESSSARKRTVCGYDRAVDRNFGGLRRVSGHINVDLCVIGKDHNAPPGRI